MGNILLVDTTELVTEIIGDQLEANLGGYQVIRARTCQEAIDYLSLYEIDYVITEYYLDEGIYGTKLLEQFDGPGLLLSFDDIKYKADAIGAGFIQKNQGSLNRLIHDWIITQPCKTGLKETMH